MLTGLKGILESKGDGWVVVGVGGVSFRVNVPASTLGTLGAIGERVQLYTYLQVREDQLALYGFASSEELGLFELLIATSGVGPKAALSLLSAMIPEHLALAISTENADLLAQVPGIGKKTAGRLILELKGRIDKAWVGVFVPEVAQANAEVLTALLNLGYSAQEASSAVASLSPSSDLSLEEKVRLALQRFARE